MIVMILFTLYCFIIGQVGVMTVFLFVMHLLIEKHVILSPFFHSEILIFLAGGIFGGLPFGLLGMNWIYRRLQNLSKTNSPRVCQSAEFINEK